MATAQNLILEGAGKGMPVGDKKERVDFGRIIGTYKDLDGNSLRTSVSMICKSKKRRFLGCLELLPALVR